MFLLITILCVYLVICLSYYIYLFMLYIVGNIMDHFSKNDTKSKKNTNVYKQRYMDMIDKGGVHYVTMSSH